MQNYVQPGDTLTLLAPYTVASGAGLLVGSIFGVASADAASGAEVETQMTGVFDLPKVASQAWTVGVRVYWDDTNKWLTSTASTHKLVGVAVAAVGSGAGEITGRVRLTGAFTI
jgi:predicted RecA/RadA family phage recombinase